MRSLFVLKPTKNFVPVRFKEILTPRNLYKFTQILWFKVSRHFLFVLVLLLCDKNDADSALLTFFLKGLCLEVRHENKMVTTIQKRVLLLWNYMIEVIYLVHAA